MSLLPQSLFTHPLWLFVTPSGGDAEAVLQLIRESKAFLELTAIDLDVESAFELAQMQRQLSQWHIHWLETWADLAHRQQISDSAQVWARRVEEMAGVLV